MDQSIIYFFHQAEDNFIEFLLLFTIFVDLQNNIANISIVYVRPWTIFVSSNEAHGNQKAEQL